MRSTTPIAAYEIALPRSEGEEAGALRQPADAVHVLPHDLEEHEEIRSGRNADAHCLEEDLSRKRKEVQPDRRAYAEQRAGEHPERSGYGEEIVAGHRGSESRYDRGSCLIHCFSYYFNTVIEKPGRQEKCSGEKARNQQRKRGLVRVAHTQAARICRGATNRL